MYQINAAQRNSTTNFILMVVYSTRKLSISSSLRILSLCQKVACIMQQAALGTQVQSNSSSNKVFSTSQKKRLEEDSQRFLSNSNLYLKQIGLHKAQQIMKFKTPKPETIIQLGLTQHCLCLNSKIQCYWKQKSVLLELLGCCSVSFKLTQRRLQTGPYSKTRPWSTELDEVILLNLS